MTEITAEMSVWFPAQELYRGREGAYAKKVAEFSDEEIIDLVQKRMQEDGEWAIDQDRVGNRAEFMRKMVEWTGRRDNIIQALEYVHAENMHTERTVDWLCRELANAAKRVGGYPV